MKNYEQIMELVNEVNGLIDTTNAKTKEMNDAVTVVKVNAYEQILTTLREMYTIMKQIGRRETFWYDTGLKGICYEDVEFLGEQLNKNVFIQVSRHGALIHIGKDHCEDGVPIEYKDCNACRFLMNYLDLEDMEEKFTIWVAERLKEKAEKANEEYAEAKAKFEEVFG